MASPGERLDAEDRNSSAREQLSGSQAESPYRAAYERLSAAFRTATARVEPGEVVGTLIWSLASDIGVCYPQESC